MVKRRINCIKYNVKHAQFISPEHKILSSSPTKLNMHVSKANDSTCVFFFAIRCKFFFNYYYYYKFKYMYIYYIINICQAFNITISYESIFLTFIIETFIIDKNILILKI